MDMSSFTRDAAGRDIRKLRDHLAALRRNKDIIGHVFLFLSETPPNASAALEAFEEIGFDDKIKIWSVAPRDGGVWESWEREALKTGTLGRSWEIYKAEHNL